MKALYTFLFAISVSTLAATASANTVQLDSALVSPKQSQVVLEGRDQKVDALAFELKGEIGANVWINEIRVIYKSSGALVTKKITVNKVATEGDFTSFIAIPDTGLPVHRLLVDITPNVNDDAELIVIGK